MSQSYPASNAPTSSKVQALPAWSSDEPEIETSSHVQLALYELSKTLTSKNNDYRLTTSEFSNFYYAYDVSGVLPADIITAQIGIKLGRIRGLKSKPNEDINYESLLDSYKDLAGYAILLYALELERML